MVSRPLAFLKLAAGALVMGAPCARAAVVNLVQNGSFETISPTSVVQNGRTYLTLGANALPGWTLTNTAIGAGPGLGPEAFITDNSYANSYGDKVPSDNACTPYPDADKSGRYALYFVDDNARQTLSQGISLRPGTYEIGFDIYAVPSGYNNPVNPTFTAGLGGFAITSATVSSLRSGVWTHFAANVTITNTGLFNFTLAYNSFGSGTAKDIAVDNFYVFTPSTIPGQGVIWVPEPASLPLLAAGMAALAARRWKRRQK